ncbi:glycosyltransferase family 2 protein [Clostridium cibarium]|uniref:Glycosyltransferase family 2 protein n=1 Tax=Clostridium cibarium TaxID=2762247 RepID=A0ABR8PPW3_9CLOT|nr:glycosyltransferase family 2 protein [Clostridium cibarium]MBD7910212.1 glycosyltransferase family 2 protein [Clostridium cibarium]
MGVSVVIPNYNGEKYLKACLESLMEQTLKPEEIIIVDNNSKDGSIEYIKNNFNDKVTLICLEDNYGFSKAVNEGIKKSESEFVALLNNDTQLHKDWLKELYNCMKSDEQIFSCCSKMLRFDNREIIDDAGDEYTLFGWGSKIGDGKLSSDYEESREVFSSCAGAAIYRSSILEEIGLFDENFFAYLEDMDISYRARVYGYKNYFSAKAKIYHIGSATSGSKHNSFKVKLSARNNIYLIYKNMPNSQIVLNFIFIFAGVVIKWIYFIMKGLGRDYISGVLEGLKTKSKIHRLSMKNNLYNYRQIQKMLFKNTINLLKRG